MHESPILSALQKGVTAAVAAYVAAQLPTVVTLPVAYVQKKFTKPADGKYLEIVWIPSNPTNQFWGDEQNYQGMLRLVLHWPNDGGDAYRPLNMLAGVCSYFTKDRLLSGVQVTEIPQMTGSPIAEGEEMLYPASLRYQSFRS